MLNKLLRHEIFIIFIFLVVTGMVYSLSLKGEFLHMDDMAGVVESPLVENTQLAVQSKDIKSIVYSLIESVFGENPLPFHVFSIILHFINSVLIFYITKLLFGKKPAFIAALLFIVHPANTEAVSWISASIYLFQAFFWLSAILFFTLSKEKNSPLLLISSYVMIYIYAFFIKSAWVVCIPLIITALDIFVINKNYDFKKALKVVPYYLAVIYYLIFNFGGAYQSRITDLQTYYVGTQPQNRVVSILRVIYNSFGLYLFPYKLNILFGDFKLTPISTLLLFSTLGMLIYLFVYFLKNERKFFGLLTCIYLSILPLFSPISIGLGYAERYFYLGTFFFSILAVLYVLRLEKLTKKKNLTLIIFSIVIILFSFRTMIRTLDWRNDRTIWTSAKAMSPKSFEVYNELGNVYYREDNLQEALKNYQEALKIRPKYPEVIHNIGLVYTKAGQMENAKSLFARSLQLNPMMYESYYRLGQIAAYEGNHDLAAKYFAECLRINPNFEKAKYELSRL